jgi:toxin-antitoxin system PIN domain toxin
MRALLDVNVLVALLDRQHTGHVRAHEWLSQNLPTGWASCPLTQNGCLRVLTNPRYPAPVPAAEVLAKLRASTNSGYHEFWPDDLSVTADGIFDWNRWQGHQQVTDVYLLALAVRHGGRLVTFDQTIPREMVTGSDARNLAVL